MFVIRDRKRLAGCLALLVLLVLVVVPAGGALSAGPEVEKKVISEESKKPPYKIQVEYPILKGISNRQAEAEFNRQIKAIIDSAIRRLKNGASEELSPELARGISKEALVNSLYIDYSDLYLTKRYISLVMNNSEYFAGAAHPVNTLRAINFNFKTVHLLRLSDLFLSGSGYVKFLSNYCKKRLSEDLKKKNLYDSMMIESGASAKEDNFENFLVKKSSLIILFDYYQVACYAAGPQRVEIPFKDLSKYLLRPKDPMSSVEELTGTGI